MSASRSSSPTGVGSRFVVAVALTLSLLLVSGASVAQGPAESGTPARSSPSDVSLGLLGPLGDDPAFYAYASVDDVSAGPDGIVAVGSATTGGAAWFSGDGVDWTRAMDTPDLDRARALLVTTRDPGWIAVGLDGAVLRSEDGRRWERLGSGREAADRWDEPSAITTLADGSIVVAGESYPGGPGIWRSEDGTQWRREVRAKAPATVVELVPFQDGWVGLAGPQVLVSRDGSRWKVHQAPARFDDLAVFDDRLFAVKARSRFEGLWTSDDGETWTRLRFPQEAGPRQRLTHVAAAGDRLYVLGTVQGEAMRICGEDVSEPAVVGWTSNDGATWEPIEPLPDDQRWYVDYERRIVESMADDGLVVVGYLWGEPGRTALGPVARTWTGPQAMVPPGAGTTTGVLAARASELLGAREIEATPVEGITASGRLGLTPLQDGGVLLASDGKRSRLLRFSPPDGVSSIVRLPSGITDAAAVQGADGRIHVIAPGEPIRTYVPARGRWRSAPAGMPAVPTRASAAEMPDGDVLIASSNPYDGPERARFHRFDPDEGTLDRFPFPGASRGHAVLNAADGSVMAISRSRIWRHDPEEGWVAGAMNPHLGDPFFGAAAAALADGRIALVVPEVLVETPSSDGCRRDGDEVVLLDLYDPVSDTWSMAGTLPDELDRQWVHAAGLPDGSLLLGASDRPSGAMDLMLVAADDIPNL